MSTVDGQGAVVASYNYDPYGNLISDEPAENAVGHLNPLRYREYYYDSESGFYYLQSRYYDPELGRFINADSYASTGQGILSNNMFAYCGNCPVVYTDPSGEAFVGAGVQLDISTGNYECGIEVIVYWDEDVCQGEGLVVAVYVYEGMSVNLDELYKNPDVINTIKQLTLALASNAGVDYETLSLVELQAVLFGLNVSGSLVFIWGYEGKFDSTDDYAGPFTSYSGNVKHVKATFSYCDTCWSVAIGGTTERKPHLSYGQTNYTQIYSSLD